MLRKTVFIVLISFFALPALAQPIDPAGSSAVLSAPACMLICPAGDGDTFGSLGVDVTFTVNYVGGTPVTGLTYGDFEIDGITPFRVADAYFGIVPPAWDLRSAGLSVLAPGVYRYRGALLAGGNEPIRAIAKVRGTPLTGAGPMPLRMVSPDLSRDGIVNLSDIAIFAAIFFGPYGFAGDFNCDGAINLIDVVILAGHLTHAYPGVAVPDPVD